MLDAGTHLGPYQILGPLGAGGMGAVYRARDSRLEREVAIKVLPDHLAEDPGALARFEREAKAVAALSHPNILAIHDFGAHERIAFAVTELLEGETLRDRLTRAALPWSTAVEIGVAIADGIRAAHAKGIIHRDLKPENLFLTADGRVKILDFGLARVESPLSAKEETRSYQPALTDPGTIMGTVGYMSPEQVRGQVVDARSDLFSLGCVLYEMVTGQRAFARDTAADTLAAILYDDPPKPAGSGTPIPPELDRVIRRCLDKDPEKRFPSARDLAIALKAVTDSPTLPRPAPWTSARRLNPVVWIAAALVLLASLWAVTARSPGPSQGQRSAQALEGHDAIRSLAVLPFVYQDGDADSEFLSDGVPMSLISSLSRVGELKVRPFSSASPFKREAAADPAGVGRKLRVQAVLTGRIRKRGDELFIACELVDVQTNTVLPWGEPYRLKIKDLFAIQEELARAIADRLRLQLSGEDRRELGKRPTEDRDAYQLHVLGRQAAEKRTTAGLRESIGHYRRAIQKDPDYALAYSGIADSYIQLGFDSLSPRQAFREARDHAMKAIDLDPALAEAHVSLGAYYLLFAWDWPNARKELDRALERNRNYADAYHFLCHYYETLGQMGDAIAMMKRAVDLDPTSAVHRTELAWAYYHNRDYDRAIEELREAREIEPNYILTTWFLAQCHEQKGRNQEAISELVELRDREKDWPLALVELGYAYAAAGREDQLRRSLKELEELRMSSADNYVSRFYEAAIFVARGQHDEAFRRLGKAIEERDPNLVLLKVEPKFADLRSDRRYVELLRQIGIQSP